MKDLILHISGQNPQKIDQNILKYSLQSIENREELIRFLGVNGLIPLFCHHLSFHELLDVLPEDEQQRLRQIRDRQTFRNLRILNTYKQLTRTLSSLNIQHIILKGVSLSSTLYNDPGFRPMVDIDVLIQEKDIPEVEQLMEKWNAERKKGLIGFFSKMHRHIPGFFVNGVLIEFHVNIVDKGSSIQLDNEHLFSQCSSIMVHNETAQVLIPHMQLFSLCIHLYNHLYKGNFKWIWVVDIKEYIHHVYPHISFTSLIDIVEKTNAHREVYAILRLVHDFFQIPLPDFIKDRTTLDTSREKNIVLSHLQGKEEVNRTHHFDTLTHLRTADQFTYMLSLMFPDYGFIKRKYRPRWLIWVPFCYFHRLIKMILLGIENGIKYIFTKRRQIS